MSLLASPPPRAARSPAHHPRQTARSTPSAHAPPPSASPSFPPAAPRGRPPSLPRRRPTLLSKERSRRLWRPESGSRLRPGARRTAIRRWRRLVVAVQTCQGLLAAGGGGWQAPFEGQQHRLLPLGGGAVQLADSIHRHPATGQAGQPIVRRSGHGAEPSIEDGRPEPPGHDGERMGGGQIPLVWMEGEPSQSAHESEGATQAGIAEAPESAIRRHRIQREDRERRSRSHSTCH